MDESGFHNNNNLRRLLTFIRTFSAIFRHFVPILLRRFFVTCNVELKLKELVLINYRNNFGRFRVYFRMSTKRRNNEEDEENVNRVPVKKTHWMFGLKSSMDDPSLRVYSDERIVVIKDKYPKAKFHYLMMPTKNIASLKHLKAEDLELVKYMEEKGKWISEKNGGGAKFRFGYHAVPSMSHLHLHVISQDFDSVCLKTKKHWNSFTTDYFIDSNKIVDELSRNGKINTMSSSDGNKFLNSALKCHVCKVELPTMPKLKSHIQTHK